MISFFWALSCALISYPLDGLFGCDTDVHVHLFKCPYPLLTICSEVPHRTNHSCGACKYVQTRVLAGKLCFRYKTNLWHWGNLKREKENQYNVFIIYIHHIIFFLWSVIQPFNESQKFKFTVISYKRVVKVPFTKRISSNSICKTLYFKKILKNSNYMYMYIWLQI